jgi:hypothetical protein
VARLLGVLLRVAVRSVSVDSDFYSCLAADAEESRKFSRYQRLVVPDKVLQ